MGGGTQLTRTSDLSNAGPSLLRSTGKKPPSPTSGADTDCQDGEWCQAIQRDLAGLLQCLASCCLGIPGHAAMWLLSLPAPLHPDAQ